MVSFFLTFFLVITLVESTNVGTWRGYVYTSGSLAADGIYVTAHVDNSSSASTTTIIGGAEYASTSPVGYYSLDVECTGSQVNFKVCGINTNIYESCTSGPHYNGTQPNFNLTVTKLSDGASCSYSCACSGGYCVHNYCSSGSTYCGDSYCDTGESCTADNSGCSSGYSCTNGCVASGVSGGVSSGGSSTGGETTKVIIIKGNANITVPSIAAGKMSNISITKTEDVAFRQFNISVVNAVSNIKIIIIKISNLPSSISKTIEGKVYHYIQITKENITDENIGKVYIKFAVSKSWLTDNGVTASDIRLYRWSNNIWNELTTTYLSEDSTEVFYQAESPGLSYFIIGSKPSAAPSAPIICTESWSCPDWSTIPCVDNYQTRTCTDASNCGTTINKPAESRSCVEEEIEKGIIANEVNWMFYTFSSLILILVALFILFFGKKIIPTLSEHFKRGKAEKKRGISGESFIVAGTVVMVTPSIFYILLGDFVSLLKHCDLPLSSVNIGNNVMISCIELRFDYVMTYFCLLFGSILIILGLIKKIREQKKI